MSQEAQLAAQAATEVVQSSQATGGIGTLGINLKIFLAQLINFTVVLLVLWKWAYKPIVKVLEERQEKIEKGMRQAQEASVRKVEIEKEHASMVVRAKNEAAAVMEETRMSAEERKKVLMVAARDEVKGVVAQGKKQLQEQKESMIREAREEIAGMAVEAARRILKDAVDEKTAMELAHKVVDGMKKV